MLTLIPQKLRKVRLSIPAMVLRSCHGFDLQHDFCGIPTDKSIISQQAHEKNFLMGLNICKRKQNFNICVLYLQ